MAFLSEGGGGGRDWTLQEIIDTAAQSAVLNSHTSSCSLPGTAAAAEPSLLPLWDPLAAPVSLSRGDTSLSQPSSSSRALYLVWGSLEDTCRMVDGFCPQPDVIRVLQLIFGLVKGLGDESPF